MDTDQITKALGDDFDVTARTDSNEAPHLYARSGSRVVHISPQHDGTLYASAAIDYGPADGIAHCDARSYRSERGAIKFARDFLSR